MEEEHKNDTFVKESMQRLAYIRSHIVNIFKALNKIENIIESMQSHISKFEDDMKTRKDDVEAIKECLTCMEAKITKLDENIHHMNKVQEALFES